jgi:osmoprotectant transport system permease protein
MNWSWVDSNAAAIWQYTWQNALLGIVPALLGLAVSVPLGIAAARWRWFYPPALAVVNVIYAVPALALFIALIPALGLTSTTVIVALALFSLCIARPGPHRPAATGGRLCSLPGEPIPRPPWRHPRTLPRQEA